MNSLLEMIDPLPQSLDRVWPVIWTEARGMDKQTAAGHWKSSGVKPWVVLQDRSICQLKHTCRRFSRTLIIIKSVGASSDFKSVWNADYNPFSCIFLHRFIQCIWFACSQCAVPQYPDGNLCLTSSFLLEQFVFPQSWEAKLADFQDSWFLNQ